MEGDFRVAEWLVRPQLNTLQGNGSPVRVEHKIMQVLVCLASRPGEVLSKEELIRTVWNGTFVTDEVLTRAIFELRRIFADDAKRPRIIETVARNGYRIIAPVQPQVVEEWRQTRTHHKLIWLLALVALTGSIFLLFQRFSRKKAAAARIRSIAVLPLENLSHDPEQEYFADGMTEALINDLSKIGALRVISRTTVVQYKTRQRSLPEIARELKVDAIVEGSVQRSGDRVRITAELIDGESDAHLWARSFDRKLSDVLMLESELAQAVASEIQVKLTPADVARVPSTHMVSRTAHDAYLRGRYFSSQKTKPALEQSITLYQQAINEDPQYALAYAGIADAYIVLDDDGEMPSSQANPKIRAAAMSAVAADPTLAEAHVMLADVKETEWDWAGAEKEYKRAIELNPGLARAHHWYAILLSSLKRNDEAISEIERAIDLEPLTPSLYAIQSETYYLAGRYDQALLIINTSPVLKESDPHAGFIAAMVYLRRGDYAKALSRIQATVDAEPGDAMCLAVLGYADAVAGKRPEALAILDELNRLGKNRYIEPGWLAMIWVALGNRDKALDFLDQDYRLHSSFLMSLGTNPAFDSLHSERRFQDLMHHIGLPSD